MTTPQSPDIIITGAGMAGLVLAVALAKQGLKVTLLEKRDITGFYNNISNFHPQHDGRASAIAYASQQALLRYGLWEALAPYASPILDIRITDGTSPFRLHFDHRDVRRDTHDAPMGYMVENQQIIRALFMEMSTLPNITLRCPANILSLTQTPYKAMLTLEGGEVLEAPLIVAADGKKSGIRELLNIKTTRWDYNQTAIVCTIAHEKDHRFVAYERFLPGGPFAILPLQNGRHSSLVWVEKTALIDQFIMMSEEERTWHIQKRVGEDLGKIELASPCSSYTLSVCFAEEYYKGRVALIGDAAHAIHPIAGQGFNLGIQDIAALVENILAQRNLGLDIGSSQMLKRYTRTRRSENLSMVAITDSLTRLFSTNLWPVKHARRLGMGAIDHIRPLQRFFMRYAMGVRGKSS